jgi:DivIVA domain-containing protein
MDEGTFGQSRFTAVMRGYNRDQVDAFLEACEHWVHDARARIEGTDARLAEANRRAEALKVKLAELESRADAGPRPSLVSLTERTEQMLGMVREAGAELQANTEAEAIDDKEEVRRESAQLSQAARAKAKQITAAARREHASVAPSVQDVRQEADRCLEEGQAAAADRADAVQQRAQGAMKEVQRELVRLEDERRAAVEDLRGLRESLEALVHVS